MLHGVVPFWEGFCLTFGFPAESLDSEGNQADRHRAKEQDTHQTMNNSCLL